MPAFLLCNRGATEIAPEAWPEHQEPWGDWGTWDDQPRSRMDRGQPDSSRRLLYSCRGASASSRYGKLIRRMTYGYVHCQEVASGTPCSHFILEQDHPALPRGIGGSHGSG